MGDKEVNNWVDSIIRNTNRIDIQILHDRISAELESENLEMIHDRITKMCDKCDITYPEHTINCIKCHSTNLRAFKIHNNMDELQKGK